MCVVLLNCPYLNGTSGLTHAWARGNKKSLPVTVDVKADGDVLVNEDTLEGPNVQWIHFLLHDDFNSTADPLPC